MVLISYFFVILFFFNFTSPFFFWFWLELNMVLFLVFLVSDKSALNEVMIFSQCFYYFVIQSICSILFLFISSTEDFFFNNMLISAVVFMKLGLFPLYFWVFKMSEYLSASGLFFLLNFQKIPLTIFLFSTSPQMLPWVILLNMIGGLLLLFKSSNFIEFSVSSSICFFNWFLLAIIWTMSGLMVFLLKYLVFNKNFLYLKKFMNFYEYSFYFFFKIMVMMIFMMGLPPFMFFFVKFYVMSLSFKVFNFYISVLIWIFSFLCLFCYFNFFFFMIMKMENFYSTGSYTTSLEYLMILILCSSMILFF